ncbi:phosphoinositide 3-kinase regulatory subunit 4-like [Acropora millepora]|uniref:phosphoinositide 3-kinase regulatory subunit 4-like n=1 Tax=Acropora millepora TaxID=45264 RepID=UPI001CF1A95C|nr:phosphoinositide 3-kinase regulatory subunit 4-like [Acropora millepora]
MRNQLSGIAPSQILSVEHYFSDLSDFDFHCREWLCVVKVFAIQDPSLNPLKTYQDQLTEIKNRLAELYCVLRRRTLPNFVGFV